MQPLKEDLCLSHFWKGTDLITVKKNQVTCYNDWKRVSAIDTTDVIKNVLNFGSGFILFY